MSIPLLKIEIKSNYKLLLLFIAIITLYAGIITAMYDPKLGEGINALAQSMPELFAAFGMTNPGITLLDFLINYLYGFILIIIPFVFMIIMCYKLVVKYVEKGSMAYLLNSHYSRQEIIMTQGFVLLMGILFLVLYSTLLVIVCSTIMFEGELNIPQFLVLNIGLLCLHMFLGMLCFMFACLFNEMKYAVGMGAGLGFIFVLIQMLSQVNTDIEFLKYFTPLSLFMPKEIVNYETNALLCLAILLILSIVFYVIGLLGFKKKDLPI